MAKRTTNAVSKHAQKASAKREVAVDTSYEVKEQTGAETATEREIANINSGRTLNYVFRQLNQEFLTFVHLVDVRVAFFNGYVESKREVPLYELDDLLAEVSAAPAADRDAVRARIVEELSNVFDYQDQVRSVVEEQALPADPGRTYLRVPKGANFLQEYTDATGNKLQVPGVIISANKLTLRTEGVMVDALLGQGEGLDQYSIGLQSEAVKEQRSDNRLREAEAGRVELGIAIVTNKDDESAKLFAQVFPPPPVVKDNGG